MTLCAENIQCFFTINAKTVPDLMSDTVILFVYKFVVFFYVDFLICEHLLHP